MLESAAVPLRTRLGVTAQGFARSAIKAWSSNDIAGFYLNAGTALELAVKARLCGHGVALLGPSRSNWFAQVIRLVQDADAVGDGAPFTVSGSDALDRLVRLEPSLSAELGPLIGETLDRCNMVKHIGSMAEVDLDTRIAQAAAFVRAVDLLVQIDPDRFWADHLPVVESLVQDALDAVEMRVEIAESIAKERLAAIADHYEDVVARVRADIDADEDGDLGLFTEVECPVCGSPARAFGELVDNGDVDVDWNPDGVVYHWAADPTTIVDRFRCEVCEFTLEGREEIAVGRVPAMVSNERVEHDVITELTADPDWDRDY